MNTPSKEELEKQHKEIMENRVVRDELLKLEVLIAAAFAQVNVAQEKCEGIDHLRDTQENIKKISESMHGGPRHRLLNVQLTVDHRSAYTD